MSFTPAGGRIDLELFLHPAGFTLRVRDTGCGISPGERDWLFTAFHQPQENRHPVTGQKVGLGLAVVQHYVQLLGGTIEVKSAENQGSEFTVILPWHTSSQGD